MAEVVDIHVHFGCPKNKYNKCYWSSKFQSTPAYWFMKLTTGSLFKKLNFERVQKLLLKAINRAKNVDRVVLLAMDEVYHENGERDKAKTHLYVPNEYIVELMQHNDRILLGASVHPYRDDWKKQLEYCWKNGARLVKWIPSSQLIDPEHTRCEPFYDWLAEHNMPLLAHCGPEYAIPTSDRDYDEKNNPKYLRKALKRGVTVIIAHCSLPFFGENDRDYLDDLEEFYKLFEEAKSNKWKLYADVSALATPLRNDFIAEVKSKIPHDRLLFGSDYPIPPSELAYKSTKNIFHWIKLAWRAASIKNPLDKNYKAIKQMGFEADVFTNPFSLFAGIKPVQ